MKKIQAKRWWNREGRVLAMMVGIALILVLLIILVARRNKARAAEEESRLIEASIAESESVKESIEASIAESIAASLNVPKTCESGEVYELVMSYFKLRQAGDAEGLSKLFGRDTSKGIDEEYAAKLKAQSSWIRSFDDIQVWLLPEEDEETKVGIVKYKINFRRVSAKAPGIMYFYLVKDGDGNWKPKESLLKETREYLQEQFEETGVNAMIEENTEELKKLLEEDSDLALMYTAFQNREIYSDYNLDPDREQQVDLFTDPEDSILLGE